MNNYHELRAIGGTRPGRRLRCKVTVLWDFGFPMRGRKEFPGLKNFSSDVFEFGGHPRRNLLEQLTA